MKIKKVYTDKTGVKYFVFNKQIFCNGEMVERCKSNADATTKILQRIK